MSESTLFPDLPDAARVWIRPSTEPLPDDAQASMVNRLESFVASWRSHDRPVRGAVTVLHDRFLVLAATLEDADGSISGCGIDASVHAIDEAAASLGVEWAPALHVLFQDATGTVQSVGRPAFRQLVDDGTITGATRVFDPSVTTLGAVRDGAFAGPARELWHARVFRIPEAA